VMDDCEPYGTGQLKCDGTRAETRFRLSAKRMNPFKSEGASVYPTTGSRGVRISGNNAGYTMFRGSVKVLATHSIRQFSLQFPFRASSCAITLQLESTHKYCKLCGEIQCFLILQHVVHIITSGTLKDFKNT